MARSERSEPNRGGLARLAGSARGRAEGCRFAPAAAAAAISLFLGIALPGCSPTSAPGASAGVSGQALNRHDEAARLISALDMSERLRNAARDYVVVQMAQGMRPKPALERWVMTEREKGATIRCKPDAGTECVAPK